MNFYNENNPECVVWLRNLIAEGLIPPGIVDGRSICDLNPAELGGFTQCHFFAGIGGWSLAARLAGVPDDERWDSGSCPCQPFSQTGLGLGFEDSRHLFPVFRDICAFRQTATVVGEQVASKAGELWLDRVFADMEALGLAVGASDLPSAGCGAPNLRQRFYWVAHSHKTAREQRGSQLGRRNQGGDAIARAGSGGGGEPRGLEHADRPRLFPWGATSTPDGHRGSAVAAGGLGGLGHAHDAGLQGREQRGDGGHERPAGAPSLGSWSAFDLIPCADGKQRRIEPGSFPLAHGIPIRLGPVLTSLRPLGSRAIKAARANRVIRLEGYGNAINPHLAAQFLGALRDDGILS
jgi:DNA (cytosine-5)-methyltransferase 1